MKIKFNISISFFISHAKVSKPCFDKCAHFLLFLSVSTFFIHHFHYYTNILTIITLIPTPNSPRSHPYYPYSQPYSLHSYPYSPHSHSYSRHPHPDSLHFHTDSRHSHHYPHSVSRFPIPAFKDSPILF